MFPHSNVHTHSTFSDGNNSLEEMLQAALRRGFSSIGFSDHGCAPYDVCAIAPESESAYRDEVLRLRSAYAGQIEVALGYEHDAFSKADLSRYDYAIESVHFLRAGESYISVDYTQERLSDAIREHFGGDAYAMCRAYYASVSHAFATTSAQIAGHIDLISKFNEDGHLFDPADPGHLDPALEALHCAAERDMIVEVNTGAMSRGYRATPYPHRLLLDELRRIGGRVTITSDCHRAEWIDFGFDLAAELLRDCGFTETWIWRDGGFQPVKL